VAGEEDDQVGIHIPVDTVLVDQPFLYAVMFEFVPFQGIDLMGTGEESQERPVDSRSAGILEGTDYGNFHFVIHRCAVSRYKLRRCPEEGGL
jgi:hypothetical protein